MDRRRKVELFEQIRREYSHGVGTIQGTAKKLGVHGRNGAPGAGQCHTAGAQAAATAATAVGTGEGVYRRYLAGGSASTAQAAAYRKTIWQRDAAMRRALDGL